MPLRSHRRSSAAPRAVSLAVVAPLLVVPALAAAAAPAAPAAAPAPSLSWQISDYFDYHLSTHTTSGGATEDAAGVVTFPSAGGTYDRATGAGTLAYAGSVTGAFEALGATQYRVTVADPIITIDEGGNGEISVVLSSEIPEGSTEDPDATSPARVVAAEFDANRWTRGEGETGIQTATPFWDGVLPPGSAEADELGIASGQPIDGKSFHPDFLGNLVPGVRALFHASGSSNDARKAPAVFVARAVGTGVATEPEPDPVDALAWEISSAFDATSAEHELAGGATEDTHGVVTFPRREGTYDSVTGEATVSYSGSVTATATRPGLTIPGLPFPLPVPDTELYEITVTDPQVTTTLDGHAVVTAVVSSSNQLAAGIPSSTSPARVEVVSFDVGVDPWLDGVERGALLKTPATFSASLTDQLVAPAREQFGTATDAAPDTLPSLLVAAAPPADPLTPAVQVTTTATTPEDGVTLRVEGTGFRGRTRSGDTGVYVGLAPAGERPADLADFADVELVPAADVVGSAFTRTLQAPASAFDPAERYAVHTWQAPDASTDTQDTATAVPIDFVALGLAEPLVPAVSVTEVARSAETVSWRVDGTGFTPVTNPGDAGVYVGLAESGGLPDVSTMDLEQFVTAAWIQPGDFDADTWSRTLTASWADLDGSTSYSMYTWQAHTHSNPGQDTETPVDTAPKSAVTLSSSSARRSAYGARASFVVSVAAGATGTVRMTGLGAAQEVAVRDGEAVFRVPGRLAAGTYRARLAYSGDAAHAPATGSSSYRIVKAVPVLKRSWKRSPSTDRQGRLLVRLVGPAAGAAPTGLVTVTVRPQRGPVHQLRAPLDRGRAILTIPALPKGTHRFVVRYAGSANHAAVTRRLSRSV